MKYTASLLALMSLSDLAHALSGQVTDADGAPIANATIELVGSRQTSTTDEQGQFTLDMKDKPPIELHINAPYFSHKTLRINDAQRNDLRITLRHSAIEQVDVTATPLHTSIMESAQPVSVLTGEALRRKQASTLGETLKNEIGVHSSYFGPVSSSPIIRGLNGPRVLITQNGLDVSDASRVGPDHVVATEASTAEQIEILRGPATLFYGSGAIGGTVNIVDDRVPSGSESKGAFALGHNTVADEDEASFAYTGGGEKYAIHVDGFWRDGSNYEIPGNAESAAAHEAHEEHEEHEEQVAGVLLDSASESKGFNIGGSWLLDNGFIGLSYGHLERVNGIPGHGHGGHEEEHEHEVEGHEHEDEHGHEGEEAHAGVTSDLKQDRWQLISELAMDGSWLRGINSRLGYTDYEHVEIEGGSTGTVFRNETLQARVDLLLQEMAGWRGALSLEAKTTDFEAVGAEAFTPPSQTDSYAIAMMQEKHAGDLLWQLGARIERVSIEAEAPQDEHSMLPNESLNFTPVSVSAGVVWDFAQEHNLGLSLSHAQRAPSAAEIFSFGPHIGTGTFEVGALFWPHNTDHLHFHARDTGDIKKETSNNIDLTLRKHTGDLAWVINVFYNRVDNFYYERNTGFTSDMLEEHGHGEHHEEHEEEGHEEEHAHDHGALPIYVFEQADVDLYGLEAQLGWRVSPTTTLTFWGDSIRGKLRDGGNLPRIPPVRLGGEMQYQFKNWQADLSVSHYFEQDNIADMETETDAYTLVDAEVSYTFNTEMSDITLYVKGSNLTDEEARVHSSFLKDCAPLPGRGFSVGIRGLF